MNRPTPTDSEPPALRDLSLYWIIRSSQFMGVTQFRSQDSSEWAGTWDWMNTLDLDGSMPDYFCCVVCGCIMNRWYIYVD